MDIRQQMTAVPEFDRFLTVDELKADIERIARAYPDIGVLERVGTSRLGEPIEMLSIGSGERNILLYGAPHPNEPVGTMVIHHLARRLSEDRDLREAMDVTWHLIPCIDPDGMRLNEGWFGGPFTLTQVARHSWRPAHRQVDWTFPNAYRESYFDRAEPETQAVMRVIDRLKPMLMGSLHNADFGGVYYYLSRDEPALHDLYQELPGWEGLTLQLGEPEVPYAIEFAPAIFKLLGVEDMYDYAASTGQNMTGASFGGGCGGYAERYGTLTQVVELAVFDDPRVSDRTVTTTGRRDAILAGLDVIDARDTQLDGWYAAVVDDLTPGSDPARAVATLIMSDRRDSAAQRRWVTTAEDIDRPATVAELFSNDQEPRFQRLLTLGMLVRMLESEIAMSNGTSAIRRTFAEANAAFEAWAAEIERDIDTRAVPIRNLVAVQLGAMLAAAQHLSDLSREPSGALATRR